MTDNCIRGTATEGRRHLVEEEDFWRKQSMHSRVFGAKRHGQEKTHGASAEQAGFMIGSGNGIGHDLIKLAGQITLVVLIIIRWH